MSPVICDIGDRVLADAVVAALAPRPCDVVTARGVADAVALAADLAAQVVVVAADLAAWRDGDDDARHVAITLVADWWARAAATTDCFLVLVSHAEALGDGDELDEFTPAMPATPLGRALRGAEHLVVGAGPAAVVRHDGAAPDDIAELVAWAATGRVVGTWHVGGGRLTARHTRLTRQPVERINP